MVQRMLDIAISSLSLVFLGPLMVPVIIILKFTGEGEIFFRQSRVGKNGEAFMLYKFATMLKDSPNIGTGTVTLHEDPRILPFGRWLRRTKINELPQIINVFVGDMSIIGPRPQTQRCFNAFPLRAQNHILRVRPGLSGIGSIVFRNEEEAMQGAQDPDRFYDEVIMPYKGELEIWYVENNTLLKYAQLIGLTLFVVLFESTNIVYKLFPSIPVVPELLKAHIVS